MKMKKILTAILVIVLIISNAYFIYESQKSDYEILIGVPVKGEDDSAAVNYQKSKPLTEKRIGIPCSFPYCRPDQLKNRKSRNSSRMRS